MIAFLTILLLSQTGESWHDRYIEDNCNRCPECCVSEGDCVEAQAVKMSEPAPCSGILWPAGLTADAIEAMNVTLPKCRVKLDSKIRELGICDETITKTRQECDKTLNRFAALTKKAAHIERPWWDNNTLWGGAGFVAGTVITVLIINAAGEPF